MEAGWDAPWMVSSPVASKPVIHALSFWWSRPASSNRYLNVWEGGWVE